MPRRPDSLTAYWWDNQPMKGRHTATRAMLLDEINRLSRALETAAALAQDVYSSDDPAGAVDRVIQHARTALGYTTVDGDPLPLGSERPDGEIGRDMTAHARVPRQRDLPR